MRGVKNLPCIGRTLTGNTIKNANLVSQKEGQYFSIFFQNWPSHAKPGLARHGLARPYPSPVAAPSQPDPDLAAPYKTNIRQI